MANPIGSVLASPDTLNHFYNGLHDIFMNVFSNHSNATTRSWIKRKFYQMPFTGNYEVAQGWFAVPVPEPFVRGAGLTDDGFDEFTYTLYVHDYRTPRLKWHINDLNDSRAPMSMKTRAEDAGRELAKYMEYVIVGLLTASVGQYLHPNTSFTTPLGSSSLFNASHTYNGQTLNNIVITGGVTIGAISSAYWRIRKAFSNMLTSNGRPYWNRDEETEVRWDIWIPVALEEQFNIVSRGSMVALNGGTAPSTNVTMDVFGNKTELHVLELLTSATDFYVFRETNNDGMKPFVEGNRLDIERKQWTRFDSDWSKKTHEEGIQWWMRKAYGSGVPFTAVKGAAA